jgi:uncharacterized protein YndB with AHSA1/START domain
MTDTRQAVRLDMTRRIAAPRAKVFAAWTTPEMMKQWFAPPPAVTPKAEADARPGGDYVVHMEGPDGSKFAVRGTYIEVVRDERLVFTWKWDGPSTEESQVTVEFRSVGDDTEVSLRHERLENEASRARHAEGWEGCFNKLAEVLSAK